MSYPWRKREGAHHLPGRLYRLKRDGSLFVPIYQVGTHNAAVVWRCLTPERVSTLWLQTESYDLVEEV